MRICVKSSSDDEDQRELAQNKGEDNYEAYRFVDMKGEKSEALLVKEFKKGGRKELKRLLRDEGILNPYLYREGEVITKERYLRWKSENEGSERDESKEKAIDYPDCKACWSLQSRGSLGEAPLHLCFLNNNPLHTKIAHVLLEEYPAMALDKYEGGDYFGETSLHIAIVNGDLESVKLLVKCGSDLKARATGKFFLPEDSKTKINLETNFEGYAYYGEYPAAFAACFGHEDMYDVLVRGGADPNLQDSFGNTVLHLCVIHDKLEMYKHALHRKHKIRGDPNITNHAGLTPLALAAKFGRKSMFQPMLEFTGQEFWSFGYINCSAFPLEGLDSIDKDGRSNQNSALITTLRGESKEHLDLLDTGIMFRLLEEKWEAFAKRSFYTRMMFAVLYLIAFSLSIYLRPRNLKMKILPYNLDKLRLAMEAVTVVGAIIFIGFEIKHAVITQLGFNAHFRSLRDAPGKCLFLVSCVLIVIACPLRYLDQLVIETHLMVIAAPMAWCYLLFFCRGFSAVGPFVGMVYKMCAGDMTRFVIIYVIFLAGLVQAFKYLMQGEPNYEHEGDTFLSLLQMTFGEFDYAQFENSRYPILTKLLFFYFNLFITVLLLNMLIAMMASTYQNIADRSEKEWRRQWAEIIMVIEHSISPKELMHYQDGYSVNMAGEGSKERSRGIMVIKKTDKKSKADVRKSAVQNWKVTLKQIVAEISNSQ
ncbi:transient receptor potential cation channel subfamily V member 6-like isoform X2 [Actinia tenebrosa]|uniref:Transient receptor potential cation channel subfamily V member 6-like isoform X2 n=1 Tax=Actinia tenebrosa TaxID=6105 RepID=A0A6P8HLW6_ACTTE|nr:transient receptor potential cation channel subfamily V member 6-like isoform X2 [Actinia tenebrosa]